MNPFSLTNEFDSKLYAIISTINKPNSKTKTRGLCEIIKYLDKFILYYNIDIIKDTLVPLLSSEDVNIKHLAIDVLYRILILSKKPLLFKELMAIWFFNYIEDTAYDTSAMILKYFNVQDIEIELVQHLDFKNTKLKSLKLLDFLVKNGNLNYSTIFNENIGFIWPNTVIELKMIYNILRYVSPEQRFMNNLIGLTAAPLLDYKWKILSKFFSCYSANSEASYLSLETLQFICNRLQYTDELRVRNTDALKIVYSKLEKPEEYLIWYIETQDINGLCIFEFINDISILCKDSLYDKLAILTKNVVQKHIEFDDTHDEELFGLEDFRDCEKLDDSILRKSATQVVTGSFVNEKNNKGDRQLMAMEKQRVSMQENKDIIFSVPRIKEKSQNVACKHKRCDGIQEMYNSIVSIIKTIPDKYKMKLSNSLGVKLNPFSISDEIIEKYFDDAVHVFPKVLLKQKKLSCNLLPLFIASQSLFTKQEVEAIANRETLKDIIPVYEDTEHLKKMLNRLNNADLRYLFDTAKIPSNLNLLFLYKLRNNINVKNICLAELFDQYLEHDFMTFLFNNRLVDRFSFYDEAVGYICGLKLHMSTFYSNMLFDRNPYFYKNIGLPIIYPGIRVLRKVYTTYAKFDFEKFMLLVLDAICYEESDSKIINELKSIMSNRIDNGKNAKDSYTDNSVNKQFEDLKIGSKTTEDTKEIIHGAHDNYRLFNLYLKDHQHFVEKVKADLGIKFARHEYVEIKPLVSLGGYRAIDYVFRSFALPYCYYKHIDFTFLSSRGLTLLVKNLCKELTNSVDYKFDTHHTCVNGDTYTREEILRILAYKDSSLGGDSGSKLIRDEKAIPERKSINVEDIIGVKYCNNVNVKNREYASPNHFNIIKQIEDDRILKGDFREERLEVYSPLIAILCKEISGCIINNYSISKLSTENLEDLSVYSLIIDIIKPYKDLFWHLLLNSLWLIRNVQVCMFVEKMIMEEEKWEVFLAKCSQKERDLFAFLFPNIIRLHRHNISLSYLIEKEAKVYVDGLKVYYTSSNLGYFIDIKYPHQETDFTANVFIPVEYPYKHPTFKTDVSKNSLLSLKISDLLRKTSKFMEIVSLWKVNIDSKLVGHTECLICYFVLNTRDNSFSNFKCNTCENKFHTRCIYKWFGNTNKRSCPLCRQIIK